MFALVASFVFLFAGGGSGSESAFMKFYNQYLNIPGFEAWKFINLAIFVSAMIYVLKKPLGEAFAAKREAIRSELIKAEAEKAEANAKLTEVEGKLAQLDTEKEAIAEEAKAEAAVEKKRLADQATAEADRLKAQAQSELSRLEAQSKSSLRRFSAEESVRMAEEKVRAQLTGEIDSRLVRAGIAEIGGLN